MKGMVRIFVAAVLSLGLGACVVDANDEVSSAADGTEITAVTISGSSSISYNATITLTATATTDGSPTIAYKWEITSGEAYATLDTTSGERVTLTANNTTSSVGTVKVRVTATNKGDSSNVVSSEVHAINVAEYGTSVKDEITNVTLSANATTVAATGTATLVAAATYTGEPTITYTWEITSGSDYATISADSGTSIKLTGKNADENNSYGVTVKVTATNAEDDSNVHSATLTFTIAAKVAFDGVLYIKLGDGQVSTDGSSYSDITTSKTTFGNDDDEVTIKYTKNDGSSTGLIKIDAQTYASALTVNLSGTMTTGGVKIQTNGTDAVNVYLNGVTITSSNYPCIDITKGSAAHVYLSGTNTLKDGRSYGMGYGEEYATTSAATYTDDDGNAVSCTVVRAAVSEGSDSKGTLYCKGDMTIAETTSTGSLSITQGYKHCIASKGTLTIDSGTYTLDSTGKHGLYGDAAVVVNDGTITFTGTGSVSTSACRKTTGIKTDTDDTNSSVTINGGNLSLTAYNGKGIGASKVYIKGGTTTVTVTGVSGFTKDDKKTGTYYNADGETIKCTGNASSSTDSSNLYIVCAPEGIEGASLVQIDGGTIEINAQDDGINVSDKSSANFVMNGGNLYVYASKGDGIDSNGTLTVNDGVIVSYAPTGSEDAFDSDGKTYMYGGIIAGTCGSTMGLSEYSTKSNGQKVLYFTGSSSSGMWRAAGGPGSMGGPGSNSGQTPGSQSSSSSSSFSAIAVQVNGATVYACTLPTASFGLFVMSCPSFTSSSTSGYTVYTSPTISSSDFHGLCTDSATLAAVSVGSSVSTPSIK